MIVHFAPQGALAIEIKERVTAYLAEQDPRVARGRMIRKTMVILAWAAASYAALVFGATTWWMAGLAATSLGLAMAGIGFAIQHDANHDSYPVGRRWRRALGFTLDLMGGSSYLWRFQHNINHHSFTNVVDADADIDVGAIARLSPEQPRRPLHRLQHVYMWLMYSLLGVSWLVWADWRDYTTSAIGSNGFPRPKGQEHRLFWLGKIAWITIALVVPLSLHSGGVVAAFLLWTYLILGFTLAVVFQLAHVVEDAEFPVPVGAPPRVERDFVAHQLATTVNFAPRHRLLTAYLGGLNFQIEHHLFPRVCHVHYPALAQLVEATCREHGATYHTLPTFRRALGSHFRWLRRMGRFEPTVS